MPVLPDVGSTIVPPGLSQPRRSASSTIRMPIRSLTEPPGFSISILATTGVRMPRVTPFSRTIGVLPSVSSTFALIEAVEPAPLVVSMLIGFASRPSGA